MIATALTLYDAERGGGWSEEEEDGGLGESRGGGSRSGGGGSRSEGGWRREAVEALALAALEMQEAEEHRAAAVAARGVGGGVGGGGGARAGTNAALLKALAHVGALVHEALSY
jgi:hypothetical protein